MYVHIDIYMHMHPGHKNTSTQNIWRGPAKTIVGQWKTIVGKLLSDSCSHTPPLS